MLFAPVMRALTGSAALLLIAGCAGGSAPVVSTGQSLYSQSSQHNTLMKTLPGPAVAGPIVVPAVARDNGPGYMSTLPAKILYVADANDNQVLLYDPTKSSPTVIGKITQGVSAPIGLAIDSAGTLYVSNIGNNTITEYPHGHLKPSFTITGGLAGNYGVAVDSHGNVFASNLNNNTITGYHHLVATPFKTVPISGQPVGLAEDSKNNLYIASDSTNQVFLLKPGTKTPNALPLSGLNGPIGPTIGAKDRLYVSNFAVNQVAVYAAGGTSPLYTISSGINQPTLNGIVQGQLFFQSDQTGPVNGYKYQQTSPYSTINGIPRPVGIAGYPRQGY